MTNVGCTSVGSTSCSKTSFQSFHGGPSVAPTPRASAARESDAASVSGVTRMPRASERPSKNPSRRQGGVRSMTCSPQVSLSVPRTDCASSVNSASVRSIRSV